MHQGVGYAAEVFYCIGGSHVQGGTAVDACLGDLHLGSAVKQAAGRLLAYTCGGFQMNELLDFAIGGVILLFLLFGFD
jgi:hypothetical protein